MCQMRVVLDNNGEEQDILENVTRLDVEGDTVSVSTLFEEPKKIEGVAVKAIDFLEGKVFLCIKEGTNG